MRHHLATSLLAISAAAICAGLVQAADESDDLSKEDKRALAIGRAVLRLHELGGAGAPLMKDVQMAEMEKNVEFLSGTPANRMTWAWLDFRLKADSSLTLENNPKAEAIRQRLDLFGKLLRKYFLFE